LMLHGQNNLHGWGNQQNIDASLLTVRGFDPVTQRFKYQVNERFGATAASQTITRNPVRISIGVNFDVGPTRERQNLMASLDRGRSRPGVKASEPQFRVTGSSVLINVMAQILQQPDSLKLTRVQADSLASLSRRYSMKVDSIWAPEAKYFAALPNGFDRDEAHKHYVRAREAQVDVMIKIAPIAKALLSPAQFRKLPTTLQQFLDPKFLKAVRSGTAGGAGGMSMDLMGR